MRISFGKMGALILPGLPLVLLLGWNLGTEVRLGAQPSKSAPSRSLSTTSDNSARMDTAARHYRQYCARCHGSDYTGKAWRDRGRRLPDFTSGPWHNSRTDAQLLVSVLEGKGALMPSFTDKLSQEQARDLVLFIRKAGPTRPIAGEVTPTDFARRYAELLAELEELRKQYREMENGRTRRGAQAHDGASPARKPESR